MHMKGELRAGERESAEGKRSAPDRWAMVPKERAMRPQRVLCQETSWSWVVASARVVPFAATFWLREKTLSIVSHVA